MILVNELKINKIVECPSCHKRKTKITLYLEINCNAFYAFLDCPSCCEGEKLFVTTSFLLKNIKKGYRIIISYDDITEENLFKMINESIAIKE